MTFQQVDALIQDLKAAVCKHTPCELFLFVTKTDTMELKSIAQY